MIVLLANLLPPFRISVAMNSTCFQDAIEFIQFSISPEFLPVLMDKDLLHKIFVPLREVKQEDTFKAFR